MIELIFYYLPYVAYQYYDKQMIRAFGVVAGISMIYFFPIFIYFTEETDCFYFIETPGEYYRHHPVTLIFVIPMLLFVWLFFKLKRNKILKKYEEYAQRHEALKKQYRNSIIIFIVITLVYIITSITLIATHIIPPFYNCWGGG